MEKTGRRRECWCRREAAGLLPSTGECSPLLGTLKTQVSRDSASLVSETASCGPGDRQQFKAACCEAPKRGHLSYPQCDWLVLECPAAASWCAGVTGAVGHQRTRLYSSICVAVARGGVSSAELWREAGTWLRFPCDLVGLRRGGRRGREGRGAGDRWGEAGCVGGVLPGGLSRREVWERRVGFCEFWS